MTTIDCPFCTTPVEIEPATAAELACDACGVHVEFADDPAPVLGAAAA